MKRMFKLLAHLLDEINRIFFSKTTIEKATT